ncbi:hypothetical protein VST7929_00318 [Vibrio stylophorae]|uniref:Methyl-accepting chemotaxis protein n=1 Tax=Vibrio stylophorae TaxID=659351 RepID=A0ABM8ZQY2_9VIBR|nr:methyl-accepting chemotaxis protein [Vibrio stylophorae]CAH0532488.1 hypothetical protein VST7929_00318 [Vibrio stylophorae]
MAGIVFKPWERWFVQIRFMPKLLGILLLSILLLIGKQVWDAKHMYQSLLTVQQERAQALAINGATMVDTLVQAQQLTQAQAVIEAQRQKLTHGALVYMVHPQSGRVVAYPQINDLSKLAVNTTAGPLNQSLIQKQQAFAFEVANQDYGYAVPVQGSGWWVIASESNQQAKAQLASTMQTMVWQTLLLALVLALCFVWIGSMWHRQTKYLTKQIGYLTQGDLQQSIIMPGRDEFCDLAKALEQTREQLHRLVDGQRRAGEELTSLAEVMAISMEETKDSAEEQFSEIDQLASAMDEMSSTVQTVAEHARNASDATTEASVQAAKGQAFVRDTITTINRLSSEISASAHVVNNVEERVDAISSVIVTIQSISEQTNLLALNAAIEAARAGDAGRGFAVVADEVRNLAQRTQTATVEIQSMINELQSSAQKAVEIMEQSVVEAAESVEQVANAGSELEHIVTHVDTINGMNFQIASAAEQQSTVANEMSQNLTNVREIVEASVTVIAELAETAEMLQSGAETMESKVKVFQL